MNNILKLAKNFEKLMENTKVDPTVVVHEHDTTPKSYMASSNLKNIIKDASELLSLLNDDDELPAWCEESLSIAKNNVNKILSYIRSEKS